ncbi:ABC transporter permease DevC [Thioclava sp. FTW29]|uniref:ABC transporter permease DevC n=1 Tax=Thioclava litoralis TaxID=3076557 RepID=A0ABZ1E5I2_9RHOB|nr:ABC transporter permease DevC [Thioclava sp. FTW29]
MPARNQRFSLAWRLLSFEPRRLLAAICGVAFAVVLILVQIGFYNAMIDSATKVHSSLEADLVMLPADFEYFGAEHQFSRMRLHEAMATEGVQEVAPLYVSLMNFKNIENGYSRSIMAIGVEPDKPAINLPELVAAQDQFAVSGAVLFDRKSLPAYFGDITGAFAKTGHVDTQLADKPVRITGLFDMGTSFIAYGTVVMGSPTFFALRPDLSAAEPSLGLIKLAPGYDPATVRDRLQADLEAKDIKIVTRADFVALEANYWNTTAAIGFIFITGALMGILVGSVIVYQILYTDVTDHLPEYATLKAMGYRDSYFSALVLKQSLILSCLGYVPGVAISALIYYFTAQSTGYALRLTPGWSLAVFLMTSGMCLFSGILALRRLRKADPAELFQ